MSALSRLVERLGALSGRKPSIRELSGLLGAPVATTYYALSHRPSRRVEGLARAALRRLGGLPPRAAWVLDPGGQAARQEAGGLVLVVERWPEELGTDLWSAEVSVRGGCVVVWRHGGGAAGAFRTRELAQRAAEAGARAWLEGALLALGGDE